MKLQSIADSPYSVKAMRNPASAHGTVGDRVGAVVGDTVGESIVCEPNNINLKSEQ